MLNLYQTLLVLSGAGMEPQKEQSTGGFFQFVIYFLILVAVAAFIYFTQRDEAVAPPEPPAPIQEAAPAEADVPEQAATEDPAAAEQAPEVLIEDEVMQDETTQPEVAQPEAAQPETAPVEAEESVVEQPEAEATP